MFSDSPATDFSIMVVDDEILQRPECWARGKCVDCMGVDPKPYSLIGEQAPGLALVGHEGRAYHESNCSILCLECSKLSGDVYF